jgi:uncharacterized protein
MRMTTVKPGGLKTLHELRQRLAAVQEEMARGPRQIQARKTALKKKQDELEQKRQALKQLKMTADQKNLQLKTNEAKINDLRAKLNSAGSNREYEILTGQIDADTMANSVLEDEILETLSRVDLVQVEVKTAEQDVKAADEALAKTERDVKAAEEGLKQQSTALAAEVAQAETILPPEVVLQYRRIVQSMGPDALSAVENKACGNCRVQLTAQKLIELGSGKIFFCTCGCLLYMPNK